MFLLYKLLETSYKNNIVACYFNHKTRTLCDAEEKFLIDLWKEKWFSVEVAECDFKKIKKLYPSKSFEELAREKRYQFFDAVCNIYNTDKVLTAHHLDDKIETFVFNMLRGSKLTGLVNMSEKSWGILRPLLWIQKSEIFEYLEKNNLKYFEDETNKSSDYTRNFLRNEVLPKFSEVHPEHKKNLQNLLSYFEELKSHLDNEVQNFLQMQPLSLKKGEDSRKSWERNYFSIQGFHWLSPLLQKEIIRYIYHISNNNSTIWLTEANIAEVLKFISGKNNKTKKEIRNMNLFKDGDELFY